MGRALGICLVSDGGLARLPRCAVLTRLGTQDPALVSRGWESPEHTGSGGDSVGVVMPYSEIQQDELVVHSGWGSTHRIPLSRIDPDAGRSWPANWFVRDVLFYPAVWNRDVRVWLRDGTRISLGDVDDAFVEDLFARARKAQVTKEAPPFLGPPPGSPAGWYPSPHRPGLEGYWTGHEWAGSTRRAHRRRNHPRCCPGVPRRVPTEEQRGRG